MKRESGDMRPELITFDAYAALTDYRSSLLPAIESIRDLDSAHAAEFLDLWRARQLGIAALSNALERGRISFRDCTALALDYALNHYRGQLCCAPLSGGAGGRPKRRPSRSPRDAGREGDRPAAAVSPAPTSR